jgi:D-alanine--poly(phosphoribitol) ligase subunit 1
LDEGFDQNRFPKLKQFVLIGEVLPKPLARDILKRFPKTTLSNFYGPTEATVATTVYDVTLDSLDKYPTIPIGKSKPRSKILIEEGEIVIVGPNVSPGYVNDDERTNQVFVKRDGIQAYKTGDLGFFNEEGLLFYERRKDLQIKMNGYRIELGEIEAHLLELPDVKNCCVIPKISEGKVQRLCAFIILRSEDRIVTEVELKKRIRNSLMERLPAYMVPRQFVLVDVFPMNANGKADRRRLEEMA